MSKKYFFVLAILFPIVFSACKKANEYPPEPEITFKSLTTEKDADEKDIHARLTISFTDGDGDIGLESSDVDPPFNVGSPYYYNCITKCFKYNGSAWVEVVFPTAGLNLNGRIRTLTPAGTNKALKGDIEYYMYSIVPGAVNLPIRFEMYIYDRALHRSNTITSSEIIINTN